MLLSYHCLFQVLNIIHLILQRPIGGPGIKSSAQLHTSVLSRDQNFTMIIQVIGGIKGMKMIIGHCKRSGVIMIIRRVNKHVAVVIWRVVDWLQGRITSREAIRVEFERASRQRLTEFTWSPVEFTRSPVEITRSLVQFTRSLVQGHRFLFVTWSFITDQGTVLRTYELHLGSIHRTHEQLNNSYLI